MYSLLGSSYCEGDYFASIPQLLLFVGSLGTHEASVILSASPLYPHLPWDCSRHPLMCTQSESNSGARTVASFSGPREVDLLSQYLALGLRLVELLLWDICHPMPGLTGGGNSCFMYCTVLSGNRRTMSNLTPSL